MTTTPRQADLGVEIYSRPRRASDRTLRDQPKRRAELLRLMADGYRADVIAEVAIQEPRE